MGWLETAKEQFQRASFVRAVNLHDKPYQEVILKHQAVILLGGVVLWIVLRMYSGVST